MSRRMPDLVTLLACLLVVSCAGDNVLSSVDYAQVVAALGSRADLPPEIESITLAVSGDGLTTIRRTLVVTELADDDEIAFHVSVPPGRRTFSVCCYNADGFGVYRGERTIILEPRHDVAVGITMAAYGLIRGAVYYVEAGDLLPLPDFEQDDIRVEDGWYRLEAPAGTVTVELTAGDLVAPGQSLWGFTEMVIGDAGEEVLADLVLVDRAATDFDKRPRVTGAFPHQGISPGQRLTLFGAGFAASATPAVWFGSAQPGESVGEGPDVVDDSHLEVTFPASAPGTGYIFVCLSETENCSNPFPYSQLP